MADSSRSSDPLGIKPFGKAINTVAKGAVGAAEAFLGRICLPAAEEFGLLVQEQVHWWRVRNYVNILSKAENLLKELQAPTEAKAPARLVCKVFEEGSWIEDETVQNMWAGLLASSCSDTGVDDDNLIFINLLSELSVVEARILKYACENAKIECDHNGLVFSPVRLFVDLNALQELAGVQDIQRLDRELDHLRSMDLLDSGFHAYGDPVQSELSPRALAIQLYVRACGARTTPAEFFGLKIPPNPQPPVPPTVFVESK